MINTTGYPDETFFMFICLACGNTERIDYQAELIEEEGKVLFNGWYRIQDGQKRYCSDDTPCKCGKKYRQVKRAKVIYKAGHTCDKRCKEAKSEKCLCSCNGANHGIHHRKKDTLTLF